MHYKTCEICGLKAGREGDQKRIFMAKFPLNEDRCKLWVKVTGKADLLFVPIEKLNDLKYICGNHFRAEDYNRKKTRLKKMAVPSVGIDAEPLTDEMLIDFPLHIAVDEVINISVSDQLLQIDETTQSQPSDSSEPSTSGQIKWSKENLKRTRICSPEPSTSEIMKSSQVNLKWKRICSPCKEVELTPRKRKLLKKLKDKTITIKTLYKKINTIDNIESPMLRSLITSTAKNEHRKPQGKRWTDIDKGLALSIYKRSPKAYRHLQNFIPLPSVRTLQIILEKMKMEPGIDPNIMEHLKKKGENMSEKNKICAILFDEIALKKRLIYNVATDKIDGYVDLGKEGERHDTIADHALVFMLQGIHKKMKQPIAYYFVKGTISTEKLAVCLKTVIRAVTEAGYTIITSVCDQGPTNVGALNLLKNFCGNPVNSNFFLVDSNKVYIIYDVPHLFKSIRNNFLQGGQLMWSNKKAKWSHLIYLEKRNHSTLHFKKITKLHVEPKYRAKMRVKLAAQILSNTVAAILKLLSESKHNKQQSSEMLETAQVIEDLDRLFDCTNGPASSKDVKKHIRENVRENSFHHKLWQEYKHKLQTLHFLKTDSQLRLRNVRCVNGYIITISSLQDIWKYVELKGFQCLNLRQLNQDALENLFGLIRQHSPTNKNPTCHHFISALKSTILTRLSTPTNRGTNCENDANTIIFDFHDIVFQKQDVIEEPILPNVQTTNEDLPVLHILEEESDEVELQMEELFKEFDKQPVVYVSGYLASVILKGISCEKCQNSMKVADVKPNSIYNYIALREWWKDKASLTYPTINLCTTVETATKVFEREVRPCLFNKDLSKYSVTVMLAECDISWMCDEHVSTMIQQLLRRLSNLLIRNECGIVNRSFALIEESSADRVKKAQQQAVAK